MRNIGIVTTWFDRGAAYVSKAYLDILKNQHNVYIYARGGEKFGKNDIFWDQTNVTWGKKVKNGIPTFIDFSDIQNWINKNNIEIIFFNEQQSWDIIFKLQKTNKILGTYIDYYEAKTVPFFELYDFLICNTKRHFSVFKNLENCFFVPWGTDIDVFRPRDDFPKDINDIVFFHSCGMNPKRKGTDYVIEAFRRVNSEGIKLIIHSQVPLKSDLLVEIEADPRIQLILDTIKPPGLYQLGHIYLYPTRLEGIGLTIMEAMACGLPVVTTNNPPMNEFILNGINGFVIDVKEYKKRGDHYYWEEAICDVDKLANKIQLFADKKIDIQKLSFQSRKYAVDNLNWKKNSDLLYEIFENLNKKSKKTSILYKAMFYEYSHYPYYFTRTIKQKLFK